MSSRKSNEYRFDPVKGEVVEKSTIKEELLDMIKQGAFDDTTSIIIGYASVNTYNVTSKGAIFDRMALAKAIDYSIQDEEKRANG